ncbi:uncharacterized protein MONBRDRAFT_22497 [Monosiga brevicollis MX1]|uniref:Large ribosomal subunit protein uL23m n=1 Tax=Monosiga brevicollis TaxID=81824 RepID=A9UQR9_MONBE|nr:uncharacterized protein MONBRDRAFT_22497 [Monosiga brevicollis MX1]EDQ93094.1 predicted protein [Monosiga brevicollis MX1]|eukprot:XP_001742856.1 hypothetical protein [Monosiga brevicollis MX1]
MPIQQGQVATHPKSGRPIYPRNEAVRRERAPNDLVFRVDMKMNKPEIKNYLSSIYGLEVERVNTQIVLGKTKRNRRTNHRNKRADYKLAYVTLPEGQHFEFPSKELLFELETDE